jgi:hypothetical protein
VDGFGEVLTIRLLREVWPQAPPEDDFYHGNENEEAN